MQVHSERLLSVFNLWSTGCHIESREVIPDAERYPLAPMFGIDLLRFGPKIIVGCDFSPLVTKGVDGETEVHQLSQSKLRELNSRFASKLNVCAPSANYYGEKPLFFSDAMLCAELLKPQSARGKRKRHE